MCNITINTIPNRLKKSFSAIKNGLSPFYFFAKINPQRLGVKPLQPSGNYSYRIIKKKLKKGSWKKFPVSVVSVSQ